MPIIPERSSPINVNIMSALAPHRHGPFILKGVQPVIEVPIHTPVRSYLPDDSDERGGLELLGAPKLQACTDASDRIRIELRAPWTCEQLVLIAPFLRLSAVARRAEARADPTEDIQLRPTCRSMRSVVGINQTDTVTRRSNRSGCTVSLNGEFDGWMQTK
jgi:hypothetical protein